MYDEEYDLDFDERPVPFNAFEPESVRVIKYSALAAMVAVVVVVALISGWFAAVMALVGMGLTAILVAAYEAEGIAKANQRGRTDHP